MKYLVLVISIVLAGCSTLPKVAKDPPAVAQAASDEQTLKRKVAIARFSNETQYAKGVFYDKDNDPVSKQAVDILSTKLASTKKFILLERADADKVESESKVGGTDRSQNVGADYLIIGSITEFGRKNVGENQLLSQTKVQIVQAGVSVRLVDVSTGEIIYSEEAKGEAETSNKSVLGFGAQADFDATLSDKAISAAISKLVENIVNNCLDRPWKSYFLSYDNGTIIIAGGKAQGLKVGTELDVVARGKEVKNPQTGLMMELPGESVGKVRVVSLGGNSEANQFSVVTFVQGSLDGKHVENLIVQEVKK
jgi:curli biogenesis system outer membrane secretion channel CsgG